MGLTIDDLVEKVSPAVVEVVAARWKTLQEESAQRDEDHRTKVEEQLKEQAEAGTKFMAEMLSGMKQQTEEAKTYEKGIGAARYIRALAAARKNQADPVKMAELLFPEDPRIAKALSAGTSSEGGFTIDEELSSEIIELLRPMSSVRSLNPVTVPLAGNTLRIPRISAGAAFAWFGENANVPKTEPVFDQITLSPNKGGALVPISNDLLRRSASSVDALVRDDLVGSIAAGTDLAFLRGTGGTQPLGLNDTGTRSPNTVASVAVFTLATVTKELGKAIQGLLDADVQLRRPGWIFAPRTWGFLITIRDGNGNLVFKPEMDTGTLFSFPFRISSQIPINLGAGTDESEVFFADFADVVIGESVPIQVDASADAAYHDGVNVVAAFSLDQTVIRAIIEVDLALRHDKSLTIVQAVKWAA